MTVDRVKVEPNERIDIADFEALSETPSDETAQLGSGFFAAPTGKWILSGFAMSNPSAKQLEVTRGTAILAERQGASVRYGTLVTEGEASRIIDLNSYASATYYIYIRFELIAGGSAERIFWDPTGVGSEYSEVTNTRYLANWSLRVELSSPGDEWLCIGSVVQSTMVITDLRPFFFEGTPNSSFRSGWSTDGGGAATDRNANRSLYGISNIQKFTAAMRQCIEDIKGRGLRAWWDADIGGLDVGFYDSPVEDTVRIGDTNFSIALSSGNPKLTFDSTDYLTYNRTTNLLSNFIGGTEHLRLGTDGLHALNGLSIGLPVATSITNNRLLIGDAAFFIDFDTNPVINFASTDYLTYATSGNTLDFYVGGALNLRVASAGVGIAAGLVVGLTPTTVPVDNSIMIGSADFNLTYTGSNSSIQFDATDSITYQFGSDDMGFWIGGTEEVRLSSAGLKIANGLVVGMAVSTTPTDDAIVLGDANLVLALSGGDAILTVDSTDSYWYDRSLNKFCWTIGSALCATMSSTELWFTSNISSRYLSAYTTSGATPSIKLFDGVQDLDKRFFGITTEGVSSDDVVLYFAEDDGTRAATSSIFVFRRDPVFFPAALEVEVIPKLYTKNALGDAYLGTDIYPWPKVYAKNIQLTNIATAGEAGYVTWTGITEVAVSSGTGTVKMNGSTSRNSVGWLTFYIETTPYYIPFWAAYTG